MMNWRSVLFQRWQAASQRDRRGLLLALAVVLAALLWLALAPALTTLKGVTAQRDALEAQLQVMLRLQAQAKALQAQPRVAVEEAHRLLEASLKPLGSSAQMVLAGEQASVTFKGIAPEALLQWLAQVRLNARALPVQARLQRNASGGWDGTLVLNLNARSTQ